jgi:hypothetical protein
LRLSELIKGVLGVIVEDVEFDDRGRIIGLYFAGGAKVVASGRDYSPCLEVIPMSDPAEKEETEKEG